MNKLQSINLQNTDNLECLACLGATGGEKQPLKICVVKLKVKHWASTKTFSP